MAHRPAVDETAACTRRDTVVIVHVREAGYVRLCCAGCAGTPRWPSGLRQRTSNPCYAGSNPARGADRGARPGQRPEAERRADAGRVGVEVTRLSELPGRRPTTDGTTARSDSRHRSPARGRPRNRRHTRRGWILVGRVRRCLARRCSDPGLQHARCKNGGRGQCARRCRRAEWTNDPCGHATRIDPCCGERPGRHASRRGLSLRLRHVRIVMALDLRLPKSQIQASSEERQGDGRRRIQ